MFELDMFFVARQINLKLNLNQNEVHKDYVRIKLALVKAKGSVKSLDGKNTEDLMQISGLKEKIDQVAKIKSVCWYGHVFIEHKHNVISKRLHCKKAQ